MPAFQLAGGLYLGWSLGANDAANVFGTAVASRIVSFRNAALICAGAVLLGALIEGEGAVLTLSTLTAQDVNVLMIASVAAAITVTLMTILSLPISTSQAVVGALAAVGLATGKMDWSVLQKIVICWAATPIGAAITACVVYKLLGVFFRKVPMSMLTRDKLLWGGLLVVGGYGSYVLGANNSANAAGMFAGKFAGITDQHLAVLGGIAIAAGVLTFSRRVMLAVGAGIMRLDAFTALVAVASMSIAIHAINVLAVPVSTSQGIVGAIVGIGIISRTGAIRLRVLRNMAIGWVMTPVVALILSAAGYAIFAR